MDWESQAFAPLLLVLLGVKFNACRKEAKEQIVFHRHLEMNNLLSFQQFERREKRIRLPQSVSADHSPLVRD
jgi:hypothetical protein